MNLVEDLKTRNIGFKVLTGQGAQIDTTTSQGKLIFGVFASLAELKFKYIYETSEKSKFTSKRP